MSSTERKKSSLLEAGIITNTHGLNGEVKVQPWADTAAFLLQFNRFFIDTSPIDVLSARVHKNSIIATLRDIDNIESAIKLKNKVISVSRDDFITEDGRHLIVDLIGLSVIDSESNDVVGEIADVLTLPSNDVYVIKSDREILVPAVPEFIKEVNIDFGYVKIFFMKGL